jgi:uroporphyrinogen-III synthase
MVQNAFTLKGRTIAITRPREQAEETSRLIRKYGGEPYSIPTIELKGTSDLSSIKSFIDELEKGKIDYVIFMSPNGIKYLFSSAESLGMKAKLKEHLAKTITMAVGPKTAQELKDHSIPVSLVPDKFSSEGILECLRQSDIFGKSIYIPRTSSATPSLANRLKEMGVNVQEIYVYKSLLPIDQKLTGKFFQDLIKGKIHAIIFSSSLGVKNFFQMLKECVSEEKLLEFMNSSLTTVAIGPVTAETLLKMGLKVDVMPKKYLFEEALIALARYWNTK